MKLTFLTLLALFAVSNAAVNSVWSNLYQFPFLDTPLQLMFGISCPSENQCFLAGGNTNTAFGVYKTGPLPQNFTNVTKLEIQAEEPPLFLLNVAMQDDHNGVTGGVEIGLGGTYFTKDGEVFHSTNEIGVVQTQAIYSLGDDKYAFIGQQNKGQGVETSINGGVTFNEHFWPSNFSTDAPARYGAFPSENVWYVTGGAWPQSNNTNEEKSDFIDITHKLRINKKTQKFEINEIPVQEVTDDNTYTAVIAKTEDAGETWIIQYHSTSQFYFNEISCASENHCIAAAEGYAQDGGVPGCHVFMTNDGGSTWNNTLVYGADKGGSCLPVEMLSETEAWVGTTYAESTLKAGAEMSHTTDGGKTWTQETRVGFVATITQMSFIDHDHAYAACVTTEQISTVMRFAPPGEGEVELLTNQDEKEILKFLDH